MLLVLSIWEQGVMMLTLIDSAPALLTVIQPMLLIVTLLLLLVLTQQFKAQPTSRTFWLLSIPAPLFLASLLWNWLIWPALFYNICFSLVLLYEASRSSRYFQGIQITRKMAEKLNIGQKYSVSLTIENPSAYPLTGELDDSLSTVLANSRNLIQQETRFFKLSSKETSTIHYQVLPNQRGIFKPDKIYTRFLSPLRLLWITAQYSQPQSVVVIPDLRHIQKIRLLFSRSLYAGDLEQPILRAEGSSFNGLRYYVPGDNPKRIAWSTTAKLDRPVVQMYQHEAEQPLFIMMDAGRHMKPFRVNDEGIALTTFDWALNSAFSFLTAALERREVVGFTAFHAESLITLLPSRQASQLYKIKTATEDLYPEAIESNYEAAFFPLRHILKTGSIIILFSSLSDPQSAQNLTSALQTVSRHHTVMLVTLNDLTAPPKDHTNSNTILQLYKDSVRLDLIEERHMLKKQLEKIKNVFVVDADCHQLNEMLCQQYVKLKNLQHHQG